MPYHSPAGFTATAAAAVERAGRRAVTRSIGSSVLGEPILAHTIGAPGSQPNRARPQVVVIAAIHGCEVIASELALALLESICDDSAESRPLSAVADLTIVPVVNVDGRTRSVLSLTTKGPIASAPRRNVNGVDLNRNWPFPDGVVDHWSPLAGTSRWHSPWYRGPAPLSEPETRAVASLVDELVPLALLNLHSTGCIVTHPWSSKPDEPADVDAFRSMAAAFTDAQPVVTYRTSQSRAWYPILGSSNDYFYDRHQTLAMTVETSPPAGAVRERWRRAGRFFWYANPIDPAPWIDNDRPGCFAALRAAVDHRTTG